MVEWWTFGSSTWLGTETADGADWLKCSAAITFTILDINILTSTFSHLETSYISPELWFSAIFHWIPDTKYKIPETRRGNVPHHGDDGVQPSVPVLPPSLAVTVTYLPISPSRQWGKAGSQRSWERMEISQKKKSMFYFWDVTPTSSLLGEDLDGFDTFQKRVLLKQRRIQMFS